MTFARIAGRGRGQRATSTRTSIGACALRDIGNGMEIRGCGYMGKMTFAQAKKINIEIWKHVIKHGNRPTGKALYRIVKRRSPKFDGLVHKKKYVDMTYGCGFCEIYDMVCRECPLFWEDAHEEPDSGFDMYSYHCSRNFWKWTYYKKIDDDKAREYAKKMLEEIENV